MLERNPPPVHAVSFAKVVGISAIIGAVAAVAAVWIMLYPPSEICNSGPNQAELLTPGHDSLVYRVGDNIEILPVLSRDSFLNCYLKNDYGQIMQLYPNKYQTQRKVKCTEPPALPDAQAPNYYIRFDRPWTEMMFLCIASEDDLHSKLPLPLRKPPFVEVVDYNLDDIRDAYRRVSSQPNAEAWLTVRSQ